jgi:hypothetical protein
MEDPIDHLFQEWNRMGGAVLVAKADSAVARRSVEDVIAESTMHCRESGRLTWVVLDWLMRHIDEIDESELVRETQEMGDLSVLGVLSDAARQRKPHARFDSLIRACPPNSELAPFFYRVARSPLALRLTQDHPLEIFRRWNYLCNELRYLGDQARQTDESLEQSEVTATDPPLAG